MSNKTDVARAEVTNGIWLCRNCHKLIDSDEGLFSSEILFAWRESHEKYTLTEIGRVSDKIQYEQQRALLATFEGYPPIIRRIVIDKPDGWEWRLAAELMRYFNTPTFRRIRDLREGLYVKPRQHIHEDDILNWISQRLNEASNMIDPFTKLLSRLTLSFGRLGEPGDITEIHHVCRLIGNYIEEIVNYEETLQFASVPDKAEKAVDLLKDCLGTQAEKLASIPDSLDEMVSLIATVHGGSKESPLVIQKTITFELPDGWNRKMKREFRKLEA